MAGGIARGTGVAGGNIARRKTPLLTSHNPTATHSTTTMTKKRLYSQI